MKLRFIYILFFFFQFPIFSQIKLDNVYQYEDGINYSIVFPINFDKNKKYFLAVGLHGLAGDGSKLLIPFSYYTRFMDIILVCPDGNLADYERNSVKWGYERSEKYLLKLVELLRSKYLLYEDILFFGFSQGGNQGLNTALSKPEIFKHFAALSGGYTTLTEKQFKNSPKVNILFLSGDTGEGEIFTKREMDNRFLVLKKYNANITRKVFNGLKHEVSFEEAFYTLEWFRKLINNPKLFQIKEDYYKDFENSQKFLFQGKLKDSILSSYESVKKNKDFAPNYLTLSKAFFYNHDILNFKKIFFTTLEYYSYYSFFEGTEIFNFFDNIIESENEYLQKVDLKNYFIENKESYKDKLSFLYKAEINFFIGQLFLKEDDFINSKKYFLEAYFNYQNTNLKDSLSYDLQIKKRKLYLEGFLKIKK